MANIMLMVMLLFCFLFFIKYSTIAPIVKNNKNTTPNRLKVTIPWLTSDGLKINNNDGKYK